MSINVRDVMNALITANAAVENEPKLQSQISDLQGKYDAALKHSQELELKCQSYRDQIESLNKSLSDVRSERDKAQFRGLELEDELAKVHSKAAAIRELLADGIGKLSQDQHSNPTPVQSLTPTPVTTNETLAKVSDPLPQGNGDYKPSETGSINPASTRLPYMGLTWSQWRAQNKESVSPTKSEWIDGGGTENGWYA